VPVSSFRFESPLVGIIKSEKGYEGWYAPESQNTYGVRVRVSPEELKRLNKAEVNGERFRPRVVDGAFELHGLGGAGTPVRWSLSRG
jgi:hypothetical protein